MNEFTPSRQSLGRTRRSHATTGSTIALALATHTALVHRFASLAFGLCLTFGGTGAIAQNVDVSPDIPVILDGVVFFDHEVAIDDGSTNPPAMADLGNLPPNTELDAYHLGDDGSDYFSLDIPAQLPGGLVAQPGDLVRWDGATYTLALDASAEGVPASADLDAATQAGSRWLLSFDSPVSLGGAVHADDDVVAFDGATFSSEIDGGSLGIPNALDVDGLHAFGTSGAIAMSFDGSGVVGGVAFDDEDTLLWSPDGGPGDGFWQLLQDSSSSSPAWRAADVGAIHVVPEPGFAVAFGAGLGMLGVCHRRRVGSRRGGAARKRRNRIAAGALAAGTLPLLVAPSVQAGDGVVEINQAAALAGIGVGDAPGFPVTLALRGSYRLTGELNVPANTSAITLQSDQVHVDLNGFSIVGGGGSVGTGVLTVIDGLRDHSVTNGTIRNMADDGIRLGHQARVEGVTVIGSEDAGIRMGDDGVIARVLSLENDGIGILAGENAIVTDTTTKGNQDLGISVGAGSLLRGVTSRSNAATGIRVGPNSLVSESRSVENGDAGIESLVGSLVADSVASDNARDGIEAYSGLVRNCVASGNGGSGIRGLDDTGVYASTASRNTGVGIVVVGGVARDNTASRNEFDGLSMGPRAGFGGNVLFFNNTANGGDQLNGGVELDSNLCDLNTNCP